MNDDTSLLDIKLLRLLDQLYATRSVTRAAEAPDQSSSTGMRDTTMTPLPEPRSSKLHIAQLGTPLLSGAYFERDGPPHRRRFEPAPPPHRRPPWKTKPST